MDIREEGVGGVRPEYLLVSPHLRLQQSGLLELVQLLPDGIGALPELALQVAQVAPATGVQEELQDELEAGF